MANSIVGLLFGLAVVVAVFLACRALVLWYWRINNLVALLEQLVQQNFETHRLLTGLGQESVKTNGLLSAPTTPPTEPPTEQSATAARNSSF